MDKIGSRKLIEFDLDDDKLVKLGYFPDGDTERAWKELEQVFLDIGYEHPEESGYLSIKNKTIVMAEEDIRQLCLRTDWFSDCVKKLSMTDAIHRLDMSNVASKYCEHDDFKYEQTNIIEERIFTFDLTKLNLAGKPKDDRSYRENVVGFKKAFESIGINLTEKQAERTARQGLAKSLEKHGFEWVQNSVYVSKKKMSEDDMMKVFKAICEENPVLYKYAKSLQMAVRGEHFEEDMVNLARSFHPSEEVQRKLGKIRDDLFLAVSVEKNQVFSYAYDKENKKYYKYNLSQFGKGNQAYASMMSLSVDIMEGKYDSFRLRKQGAVQEVSKEEFDKSGNKTLQAFKQIFLDDETFDMEFNRKNVNKLVYTLGEDILKKKEEREKVKEEYKLSIVPEIEKAKEFTVEERDKFFDDIANIADKRVIDEKSNKHYYSRTKEHNYESFHMIHNTIVPEDCPPYRYFNNPSKLWTNAFNAEEKYSPNKDAIVATKFEVSIPEGLTFIEANNALKNLTEEIFAKNGHVAQYYLLSNSNNSSSMKGVIVVADRRTKKGDFVEEKKVFFMV